MNIKLENCEKTARNASRTVQYYSTKTQENQGVLGVYDDRNDSFSRPPRYDRFDMPPSKKYLIVTVFKTRAHTQNIVVCLAEVSARHTPYFEHSLRKKRLSIVFYSFPHYDRFDMPPSKIFCFRTMVIIS